MAGNDVARKFVNNFRYFFYVIKHDMNFVLIIVTINVHFLYI